MPTVRVEVMRLAAVQTQRNQEALVIGQTIAEIERPILATTDDLYTNNTSETFAVLVRAVGQQIYLRRGRGTIDAAVTLGAPDADNVRHWIDGGGHVWVNIGPGQKLAAVAANIS